MSFQTYELADTDVSVKVILASQNPKGQKIATIVARYQRFFHSEVLTHKDLTRNASSSRAIPFKKMLSLTRKHMAAPIHWGKNQPGMQAEVELSGFARFMAVFLWHFTGHIVLTLAWLMNFTGVHKQIINRMIEPWTYINVQITATNWERMLKLRLHPAAQPEFRALAVLIQEALRKAEYQQIPWGGWHLPWLNRGDLAYRLAELKKLSAARSARLSYTPIGEPKINRSKDFNLADDLLSQLHLSPFEHQAEAKDGNFANLQGWCNFRTELGY
jgi:hypothetical protein